jgi:hypothetical protein
LKVNVLIAFGRFFSLPPLEGRLLKILEMYLYMLLSLKKNYKSVGQWWLTLVILAPWEADIRRIEV